MSGYLLKFPLDIRYEIYRQLALITAADRTHRDIHDPGPWIKDLPGWFDLGYSPSLCLTSRTLHSEYKQYFFGRATFHIIVRVFAADTDLFGATIRHFPAAIRQSVSKASVIVLWKPRNVRDKSLDVLRAELAKLHAALPGLRRLSVDFRYFDIHDLELDIERGRFEIEELRRLQMETAARIPQGEARLHLSAITSLLTRDARWGWGIGFEEDSLGWVLLMETYVCWRFSHIERESGQEEGGWYGLMPWPCSFFCYGLEAGTFEVLRDLVATAMKEEGHLREDTRICS